MTLGESPLQQAERHVRQAEATIARQERIIAELEQDGHREQAELARQLLQTMQSVLMVAREHADFERGSAERNT